MTAFVQILGYSERPFLGGPWCNIAILTAIFVLSGCRGIRVDDARTVSDQDWRQDGGHQNRDRTTTASLQLPLEIDWRYNAQAAFGDGSPLFFGNTLLVGTRRGDLYAVNIDKGRKTGAKRFAEAIEGSIVSDGEVVYIPGALGKYNMMAYNLTTGKHVWRNKGVPFETGFVLAGDILIGIDISGQVRAVEKDTGVDVWAFDLPGLQSSSSAPLVLAGGNIVVAGEYGSLFRLDSVTGEIVWKSSVPSPVFVAPASNKKSLIIPSSTGVLYSVGLENGEIEWSAQLGHDQVKLASPAVTRDEIYIGTSQGIFFAIRTDTGQTLWKFNGPDVFAAAPLITETHVFIGSMGRMLYAFNRRSAAMDWDIKLEGRIKSALAARDGELFVLTEPRHIYKFVSVTRGANDVD